MWYRINYPNELLFYIIILNICSYIGTVDKLTIYVVRVHSKHIMYLVDHTIKQN